MAPPEYQVGDNDQRNDAYEVYASRKRTLLYGIGSLLFGLVIVWMLWNGLLEGLVVTLAAVVGVPIFLGGGTIMLYQMVKHEPILRITDEGIQYNRPVRKSRFYPWDSIEQVGQVEQKTQGTTQTYLQLQGPDMNADGSTLSKVLHKLNTVAIGDESDAQYLSLDPYGIQFDEVAEAIRRYSDVPVSE